MPKLNQFIVLDLWSIEGTYCKYRSDTTQSCLNTVPTDRRVLTFKLDETVILAYGTMPATEVIVNPKLCLVCEEKPRQAKGMCGHSIMCMSCYKTYCESSEE